MCKFIRNDIEYSTSNPTVLELWTTNRTAYNDHIYDYVRWIW